MEFTGQIKNISNDFLTGELNITFSINEKHTVAAEYEKLKGCEKLSIKAVKFRKKRSKDANAYMWKLLQEMAEVLNTTKDELYMQFIGKSGVFSHVIVKEEVVKKWSSMFDLVKNLGEVTVNGATGIQLQCYFGSSTYNTKEMSNLINEIVSECKELGIETLTPSELERMKSMWGANEKII